MPFIPSNINEMLQTIYQESLIYSNRFEVIITPPLFLNMNQQELAKLTLRCDSVSVPGRSISTQSYRFYGPQRQMPFEALYSGDINLSFILSNDLRERNFFENWMNVICSKDNYKFSYYDQYATNITINILNRSDETVYSAMIEEAYPKSIGELGMAYDKENDFLRQEVTFAYRKWSTLPLTSNPPNYVELQPNNTVNNSQEMPPAMSPGMYANTRDRPVAQQFQQINGKLVRVGSDGSVNGVIGGNL